MQPSLSPASAGFDVFGGEDEALDYDLPPRPGLQDFRPQMAGHPALPSGDGQKVPLPSTARSKPAPRRRQKTKGEVVVVSTALSDASADEGSTDFAYQSLFVSLGMK
mmetsp:Transcript_45481/g.84860  ORF Transcript_45481/g.84860 Transcript_45481/m.84860 type:complete len:107 (+) Transcript_45481:2-322(+)